MAALLLRAAARRALAAAAILLLAASGRAWAQEGDSRADFREGVSLFEQGKYEDAKKFFEKFLATSPSSDLALEMENEAGYQVFVEMLAKTDDTATIARKVLELAAQGAAKEKLDADKIQALIAKMLGDDMELQYRATEELASQVGPFVVPFMVEYLADRRESEKRTRAIILLSKLGPDGTNAVIALLHHKDDFVRQNACAILGNVRDFKAIPFLKAAAEDKDESPHVKQEAMTALKKITGKDSLEAANAYFLALGERYYQEDPRVMWNNFKDWTLWDYKDEKVAYRIVPRYVWNEKQAENACYAAIQHAAKSGEGGDAVLDQIYTLLCSTLFQEAVEVRALAEVAEQKAASGGGIDQAELDALKAARDKSWQLEALAEAKGERTVLKSLRKALVDRRPELAVAMIRALEKIRMSEAELPAEGANLSKFLEEGVAPAKAMDVAPPRPIEPTPEPKVEEPAKPAPAPAPAPAPQPKAEEKPQPKPEEQPKQEPSGGSRRRRVSMAPDALDQPFGPAPVRTLQSGEAFGASIAAALTFDDKRVRYAAAETLLRLAPTKKFANADKVVAALGAAVTESGARAILVVARDVQVRNRLTGELRNMNHLAFAVESARRGVIQARGAAGNDAILIHSELNVGGSAEDFNVAQFMDQINVDYRTAGTPVVVVVPHADLEEKAKMYEKAALVVPEDEDPVVLKEKLESLWSGDKAKPGDPKSKAVDAARRAAEALASADPRSPVFDLRQAVSGLLQALETQPDAVRVPALRALGNVHAREAVDKAAAIFDNPENSKDVRIAAAYCLGEALRGQAMPQKVFESLKGALKADDAALYQAISEALGKTQLTRDQQREVFVEQRIE
jgi:outer membrane biosynthesis protein TonB